MTRRYLVTLGVEEFLPEGGRVTEVLYDDELETIMVEYETDAEEEVE